MTAFAEVAYSPPRARSRATIGHAPPSADLPKLEPNAARSLAALVAGEIVPRLMMAHGFAEPQIAPSRAAPSMPLDPSAIAPLTLDADPLPLLAQVDRLLTEGISVETLMVDLLAPAARLLGAWWEEDRCDFLEVTAGLWRLQEIVRDVSIRVAPTPRWSDRRALFAAFPGDQHDFGTVMISELFLREGWDAEHLVAADMPTLLAAVSRADYDLVGLTVSCDCHSGRLPSAILALRSVSRNPQLRIMIGGRVVNEDPALVGRVGADGTARDAREALGVAEALVGYVARCIPSD